ncbi:MAG: hypothetical protein HQL69_23795 [Magnetococcales bacterium]|nr:hypothetical protein [Magnetococcales bacterium]
MGNAENDQEIMRKMEEDKTKITFPNQGAIEEMKEWVMSGLPPSMPEELKKDIVKNYLDHIASDGFLRPERYVQHYLEQRLDEMIEKGLVVKKDLPDGTEGFELRLKDSG